jgi:alpha-mannosidase
VEQKVFPTFTRSIVEMSFDAHHGLSLLLVALAALCMAAAPAMDDMRTKLRDLLSRLNPVVNGWRFRMERDSPDGGRLDFDDSDWEVVDPEHRWQGEWQNAWYRKDIELPEKVAGFSVAGAPVILACGIDDDGEIYINGELKTSFHWGDGRAVIAERADPGRVVRVILKAKNQGGPGRLLDAKLEFEGLREITSGVAMMLQSLDIAKAVLPRRAVKRWDETLQRAAGRIDFAAAERGDATALIASLNAAREELEPFGEVARQNTIYIIGQSHIDLAWLWPWRETVQVCRDTFRSALDIMKDYPEFIFAQSQAQTYLWMEQHAPEIFEEIRQRIADGRWEIVGGMWAEPDCNLPSGESLVRQTVYGKRYFLQKFGVDVKLGWNPDSFGYAWSMPQIYKKCGVDAFLTTKIGWNEVTRFPYHAFWWEGPDGSRIFSYFPISGVGGGLSVREMIHDMGEFKRETGLHFTLRLYGVGDHGGGPSRQNLEEAKAAAALPVFPRVQHARAHDFIDKLVPARDHPVWRDELYLEHHRGVQTTHARNKRANRRAERELHEAELFCSWASMIGKQYPKARLAEAWRLTLFNQFHDILPGSSINEVYIDSAEDYRQLFRLTEAVTGSALRTIERSANTRGRGAPVAVFNSLSWKRDGLCEVPLTAAQVKRGARVLDSQGREIPSQVTADSTLVFMARKVPAMGFAVYRVVDGAPRSAYRTGVSARDHVIENRFIRAEIDPRTGWLTSIFDKRNRREVLAGTGNQLQVFEDPENAWEVPWHFWKRPVALDEACTIELIEAGPVRAVMRVTRTMGESVFRQDITVCERTPRLDVRMKVEWRAKHKLLKVAFPVSVDPGTATYEIPYAAIERTTKPKTRTEKAKFEVPAQMWADLSHRGFGVSLMNDCKYGYDIHDNVMRLSLLRASTDPDPHADEGHHEFTYSIYPHGGDWRTGGVVRAAHELNYPLIARMARSHAGPLGTSASLAAAAPENIIMQVFKRAEDSADYIVRWYETAGKRTLATITLPGTPQQVWETDLMENELRELPVTGKALRVMTGKHEIKTVKVRF